MQNGMVYGRRPVPEYADPQNYQGRPDACGFEKPWLPGIDVGGSVAGQWLLPMPGADRLFRVSGFAAIAPAGTQSLTFRWQYPGLVTALMCHDLGTVAATGGTDLGLASLALRLTVGDANEEIMSNGNAGDFVTFMAIHGRLQQPFPIMRYVHQNEVWTVAVTNRQIGGGVTLTPEVTFHYRRIDETAGRSPTARITGIQR